MKKNEDLIELEKILGKFENFHSSFDYLSISIASPERMKSWAERRLPSGETVGEVLKGETINFRTHQPEVYGLFCEKIFGPIRNFRCKCGQYNAFILDKVCEICEVELIEARVRRYRMGYIELNCPVTHLWYVKGVPNYLAIFLRSLFPELKISDLENIIYFKDGERVISDENPLFKFSTPSSKKGFSAQFEPFLTNQTKKKLEAKTWENLHYEKYGTKPYRLGAEILKAALETIDLKQTIQNDRNFIFKSSSESVSFCWTSEKTLIRRIRIFESFLANKIDPSWLILTVLPVLPPNLRPLLELESGRLVAADVNEIYRLILNRNQRLYDFLSIFVVPDIITFHARKLLQEAVDSLIDNSRLPKEKTFSLNNKPLKSLTEILEGKQGRFRQSLLGKRVDYSGRSVIIVGPHLRLNQCGLPYEMGIELFQPFLIHELLKLKKKGSSQNTKFASLILKKNKPFVWFLLSQFFKKYVILLNRAPTLHRFGIQAFDPVLILGQAIHLHPLVCTGFNADFDGDQMAVHLPLYESSQLEVRSLMKPSYNVLSPSNGEAILKPTQDMVIGLYYLTLMRKKSSSLLQKCFSNETEVLSAFFQKKINLHTPILVRSSVTEFQIQKENGKFFFQNASLELDRLKKEILILKIFSSYSLFQTKFYLVTNLGLFIVKKTEKNQYLISDFFIETTPGRLIFASNLKTMTQKDSKKTQNF